MNSDKRRERMVALMGDDPELKALLEKKRLEEAPRTIAQEQTSRDAEATLAWINNPHHFVDKRCKKCDGIFTTNYANVAYCSDGCRQAALADIGIGWDATKHPVKRWKYPVPLVVPPDVVQLLQPHLPQLTPAPEVVEQPEVTNFPGTLETDFDALLQEAEGLSLDFDFL